MTGGPAGRFLHVCYCCTGDEVDAVVRLFVEQFGFRHTMSTPVERSDGSILGLEGDMLAGTAFLYDARGPRTSPAIEVQGWIDPPVTGVPATDPAAAGIQALAIAVPDVYGAARRLQGSGCSVIGRGPSPFRADWATVRDPTGVTLDLVEDRRLDEGGARLAHLRIGSVDLSASMAWYEGLGFAVIEQVTITDGAFAGLSGPVEGRAARLRLPEEEFEAVLFEWNEPVTHGRHPAEPYHAGLFRTAVRVEDTRSSYQAMTSAGFAFDRAPKSVELRGTPVPDMWICFLSDPDGVPFEFVQRPSSAFRTG